MEATSGYAPHPAAADAPQTSTIPLSRGARWLIGTVLLSLLAIYFIGVDQGATSIFGSDMHIHELLHDARHLLGFPCH
jgi:hypothetical protein